MKTLDASAGERFSRARWNEGVGKGTPGGRLRALARSSSVSVRVLARFAAADEKHARHADALVWLKSKGMTLESR